MPKFLQNEFSFKSLAKKLHKELKKEKSTDHERMIGVKNILKLENDIQHAEINYIANKIAYLLQNKNNVQISNVQDLLAKICSGQDYHTLLKSLSSYYDARVYLNVFQDLGYAEIDYSTEIKHPFPELFKEYSFLNKWKKVWLRDNFSKPDKPFIVPAVPEECFESDDIQLIKYYSWPSNHSHKFFRKKHPLNDARAGTIVCSKTRVIGTMKWYWWGHCGKISGSDFSLKIFNKNNLLSLSFDIRPYLSLPSYGPNIENIPRNSKRAKNTLQMAIDEIKDISFSQQFYEKYQ